MRSWSTQSAYGVRFEWGAYAAAQLATNSAGMVIVDVLSFTTCVAVAVDRGTRVFPYPWRDSSAQAFAAEKRAALAVGRRSTGPNAPWSLSPAALRRAPFTPRLVLPSPNGSAIAAACRAPLVIAGCLRNAAAIGRWLAGEGFGSPDQPVTVIAAGERWPDGSLRPALEDFLGAGAIITALSEHSPGELSPEAAAASVCFATTPDIARAVTGCASGRELTQAGFTEDVAVAAALDTSETVPVRTDGSFGPPAATGISG